jgi:hypothetical protein
MLESQETIVHKATNSLYMSKNAPATTDTKSASATCSNSSTQIEVTPCPTQKGGGIVAIVSEPRKTITQIPRKIKNYLSVALFLEGYVNIILTRPATLS